MKLPCNIVQDLLPSYIDELCSEETKQQMGEHLAECEVCDTKYKEMKGELPEVLKAETEQALAGEIEPMKKIKKRHVGQVAVLVAAVLVLVIGSMVLVQQKREAAAEAKRIEAEKAALEAATLEFEVYPATAGELFQAIADAMLEKWKVGRSLQVRWEKESFIRGVRDMNLYLENEEAVYRVRTYYGYEEGEPVKVEVKREVKEEKGLSEQFLFWEDLVKCAEAMGFSFTTSNELHLDIFLRTSSDHEVCTNVATKVWRGRKAYVLAESVWTTPFMPSMEKSFSVPGGEYYRIEFISTEWSYDEEAENDIESADAERVEMYVKALEI